MDAGFVAITIDLDQQADPTLKVDQLDKLVTAHPRLWGGVISVLSLFSAAVLWWFVRGT